MYNERADLYVKAQVRILDVNADNTYVKEKTVMLKLTISDIYHVINKVIMNTHELPHAARDSCTLRWNTKTVVSSLMMEEVIGRNHGQEPYMLAK